MEERVAALEKQMGDKPLQEHFREHAELTERLLVYRFDEFGKKQDVKWEKQLDTALRASEKRRDEKFREQAELIDRLFVYRFDEFEKKQDAKWERRLDAKLGALERRLDRTIKEAGKRS